MSVNVQSHTISQRKSLKLKGTKTSVIKNQILISTGIVSLDAVLGKYVFNINIPKCSLVLTICSSLFLDGGIPIGTVALVGSTHLYII